MSKRRNMQGRVRLFGELRDVFDAMKTLAVVEVGKLTRTQQYRRRLLEEIARIAQATAAYYPQSLAPGPPLYLVIGSERGFCGDFNDRILTFWNEELAAASSGDLIIVGSALAERFPPTGRLAAVIPGPYGADDIDSTLEFLLERLGERQRKNNAPLSLVGVSAGIEGIRCETILPFEPATGLTRPPALNLARERFLAQFLEQYLDARLHDAFATSLLAENHARVQHMTAATDRIDDDVAELRRHIHRLRQEEITQEVEMILLSAGLSS